MRAVTVLQRQHYICRKPFHFLSGHTEGPYFPIALSLYVALKQLMANVMRAQVMYTASNWPLTHNSWSAFFFSCQPLSYKLRTPKNYGVEGSIFFCLTPSQSPSALGGCWCFERLFVSSKRAPFPSCDARSALNNSKAWMGQASSQMSGAAFPFLTC